MDTQKKAVYNDVVIRFCGDSGDGMQLTGNLFSNLSAVFGNEIATFPDYPAEIRAPQGTVGGVSGFQVHVGSNITTPGDKANVLVAMNAAALFVNAKAVKRMGVVIFDIDSFSAKDLAKAGFKSDNPFAELQMPNTVQLVPVQLSTLTQESLKDFDMDKKAMLRSKNMFALGLICWLFDKPVDHAVAFLKEKFAKKPMIAEANVKVLNDGFNYGHNLHLNVSHFVVNRSHEVKKGSYTIIPGNKATSFGLIAAAKKANKELFLGSYPITPATDIMHELAKRKDMGVKVVQAEDELSGICHAIGASFAGDLAVTSTSGPGLALKSEAIGLAVMAELPLVIVNVMRGGPSTGLPTKSEQTDLLQALHGRNGECPLVVIAASSSDDCFDYAFEAAKIALENMTPVILLTDAYLGNGSALWKLPKLADMPEITPSIATPDMAEGYTATTRNPETQVRYWAYPGMEGFMHRNGGLEKDAVTAAISTDGDNHAHMIRTRAQKVAQVANRIPELEVKGKVDSDTLLIGWGSTRGHIQTAMEHLIADGVDVAYAHFNYINPLPKNTAKIINRYDKVIVCELNDGQFASHLRDVVPRKYLQFNRMEGKPLVVSEIEDFVKSLQHKD